MPYEPHDREVMRRAAFLHGALIMGVVAYGVTAAIIGPLGGTPPALQVAAAPVAAVAAVVALMIRAVLRRRAVTPDGVMAWVFVPSAVLESAACVGITSFLLSGSPTDVIGPAVLVLLMLATWPTASRVATALGVEDGGEDVFRAPD